MRATMTPAPAPDDHTDAWAFVLRHAKMIDRLATRFGPRDPVEREEWVRDVTVRIVEKHHNYDPTRSAPQTWIVWQMRAVSATWQRTLAKRLREGYGKDETMVLIPLGVDQYGSTEHALADERRDDAEVMVAAVYSRATEEQRVAIRTFLAGVNATDLRKQHGMTGRQREAHLHALQHLTQEWT